MREPEPILLPRAGMNAVEATVVEWLRSPGEHVAAGEPIVAVEMDGVGLQVEAPVAGVLLEILVGVGDDAPVDRALGLIEPTD
jgi:pyruvate/2-oxoglutarate dehydrogenase complex dihydrolipoamide acyltransferase (E2) component